MASTLTPEDIANLIAKVAKEKEQRRLAQIKYRAKEETKEKTNTYMRDYRKKRKELYNELIAYLNNPVDNTPINIPDNIDKNNQIVCDCGCIVSKKSLKRHQMSRKHAEIINNFRENMLSLPQVGVQNGAHNTDFSTS